MSMSRAEQRQMQKMQTDLDDMHRLTTRIATRSGVSGPARNHHHIVQSTLPTTNIQNGDHAYIKDDDEWYVRLASNGGEWICISHLKA